MLHTLTTAEEGDVALADSGLELPSRLSPVTGWKRLAIVVLAGVTVLGIVGRLVLSWISLGSNDWATWQGFAELANRVGPFKAYAMAPDLNHPPLALLWSALSFRVAVLTHTTFPFVFRLATIATDVGCCLILYKIFTRRFGGKCAGWLAAAAFAWNLDAIMDGAYHCNTDNACAFFTLLAAWLLAERRNFLLGGLALAAAINVKIVPILLIPAFFSLCRDWKSAWQFFKGMALGAIPFIIVLCVTPKAFFHNVFCYNSMEGEWGLMLFPMYAQYIPLISAKATFATHWFHHHGKYALLALSAGLGLMSWLLRRWNAYQLGALAWCVFMIFTPAWGLQYSVYIAPLLMAASLGRGAIYGLVAGLSLLTKYAAYWNHTLPLQSIFVADPAPNPLPVPLALVSWSILVAFFCVTLWRGLLRNPIQDPAWNPA